MLIKKYEYKTQFVECNLMQLFCINSAGVPQTSNIDIKCHGIGKLSWVLIHEEVFQCFFFSSRVVDSIFGYWQGQGPSSRKSHELSRWKCPLHGKLARMKSSVGYIYGRVHLVQEANKSSWYDSRMLICKTTCCWWRIVSFCVRVGS